MEFLRQVTDRLAEKYADPGELTIVTPNRRAGLFIKKYMQEHDRIAKPVWLPQLYSIQDFIAAVSDLTFPDRLSLSFRLYESYKRCFPDPKPFDIYYPFSQILLSDFEEIDLSLADREKLFKHLRDIAQIENVGIESSVMMKNFNQLAGNLALLYVEFTRELLDSRAAYYGLGLRTLLNRSDLEKDLPGKQIIFAGFYALTKAEQALIALLIEQGRAEIYWDIDSYYYNDATQEAGHFFRENSILKHCEEKLWISDGLQSGPKTIEIIGVAGRVAQAKALGHVLENDPNREMETAVILSDESLLFPVLNSIPDTYSRFNVTMGYPLKHTPLAQLIHTIIALHDHREKDLISAFHFEDVRNLLLHPYIRPMARQAIHDFLIAVCDQKRALLTRQNVIGIDERIDALFCVLDSADAFLGCIKQVLQAVFDSQRDNESFAHELECIFQFMTRLQRLEDILAEYKVVLDLKTFQKLLKEIIDSTAVPFLGEPLEGLQVMGLLETRTLDFRNIYLLSVNEGMLPGGRNQESFIPNDVRKAFGMETWAHRDAIYAYYFYRLIQRADTVRIFYNTLNDEFGKGEKSRFIDQLLYEFPERNRQSRLTHKIMNLRPVFENPKEIVVKKDAHIQDLLNRMQFSPTRLQTYVDCSLRFYFRYILRLTEQEDLLESADAKVFGTVLHQTLSQLYAPLTGKRLTPQDIEELMAGRQSAVHRIYLEVMGGVDIKKGRNYLNCQIIETLIAHYLRNEKPGKMILGTETGYHATLNLEGRPIALTGKIDRIEQIDDVIDILDYKTGITGSLQFNPDESRSAEDLLDALAQQPQVLQLLFYFFLAANRVSDSLKTRIRLGIYSFKRQRETGNAHYLSHSNDKMNAFTVEKHMKRVESILMQIFSHLLDVENPFVRTENDKKCGFCPYAEICGR